jgi:hypothetical protein
MKEIPEEAKKQILQEVSRIYTFENLANKKLKSALQQMGEFGYSLREGNVEVDEVLEENRILKEALNKIANPISYLRESANNAGGVLDGSVAVSLSNSANWLKSIADDALKLIKIKSENTEEEK